MVMIFAGVMLVVDGILVVLLPYKSYGAGVSPKPLGGETGVHGWRNLVQSGASRQKQAYFVLLPTVWWALPPFLAS